jgi:hypothetical protein
VERVPRNDVARHRIVVNPIAGRGDGERVFSRIDPFLRGFVWNLTTFALSVYGTLLICLRRLWERDAAASSRRLESEVLQGQIDVCSAAHGRWLCPPKRR